MSTQKPIFDIRNLLIPSVLAIVFSVIIFALLPVNNNKYSLEILSVSSNPDLFATIEEDLDGDGILEFIRFKRDFGVPSIAISDSNRRPIEQENLRGEWVDDSSPVIYDLDGNGFKEIIVFTFFNDSLWLSIFEPLGAAAKEDISRAVERLELNHGVQDWMVSLAEPADMTGDQKEDLVFSIFSGFSASPRKLYIYDPAKDSLITQKASPGNNILTPVLLDLDSDGDLEITGHTFAPGNNITESELSDKYCWLIILDNELEYFMPPLPGKAMSSYIRVLPLTHEGIQYLIAFFRNKMESKENQLRSYRWSGDSLLLLNSISFPKEQQFRIVGKVPGASGEFYLRDDNYYYKYTYELREVDAGNCGDIMDVAWQIKDLDLNGLPELISFAPNGLLTIFEHDFRKPVQVSISPLTRNTLLSGINPNNPGYFHIFSEGSSYNLSYHKNPSFAYRYLYLILLLLANGLVFFLFRSLMIRRMIRKQQNERELLRYQLANVQQQLSPHFLFNVLNNISIVFREGNKEKANAYLVDISRMMVTSMENSEKMTISLAEELEFVRTYLKLERFRSGELFDYEIEISEGPHMRIQVPKMLVHNFVENAVKHGIFHLKERRGNIKIYSVSGKKSTSIVIEDNGVGREAAKKMQSVGTRSGMRNINKILQLYEELKRKKISYCVEDRVIGGEALGTMVSIQFED